MKITHVRVFQVEGVLEQDDNFWEERLVRPLDIYPEHKDELFNEMERLPSGHYRIVSCFVEIGTDAGITGLGGPMPLSQAFIVERTLKPLLLGHDPLAIERIWDRMYRALVHGRKGIEMMAISVVDCALWDLKGKWANAPVYVLLGGPTRTEVSAYASMLGYSLEPALVRERAQEVVRQGFRATKWFFRDSPTDGVAGIARNLRLAQNVRDAIGPDVDMMLDCWMSWDVSYTLQMSRRLAELHPRWLEEPVLPDKIAQYAEIRANSAVPISGGEHEYTRWGHKALLDARAVDVLQPDIHWAGGISEVMKIIALASACDVPVVPHGNPAGTIHVLAAWPQTTCPLIEYLFKWNAVSQYFYKEPNVPINGVVKLPVAPGLGVEFDPHKTAHQKELAF
jgi:L-alanine-DL-glutamate epimerase-like enolase superfamily enzyme